VLTQVNASLKDKVFGAYEQFSFPGWNNETVYGYVLKPANYMEGKKYPVAFLIHGGPQGSFGDAWSYRWNPQTYAGAGLRGGDDRLPRQHRLRPGLHRCHQRALGRSSAGGPAERPGLRTGQVLPTSMVIRVAALGASYGGFMVNWIAGVWNQPFKAWCRTAASSIHAMPWATATEELWFTDWENGGTSSPTRQTTTPSTPLLHAKDWRVPMLVIHGDKDFRVPLEQGIGSFTACQAKGIESKYLRFPDENHWVLKPQNSMHVAQDGVRVVGDSTSAGGGSQ
jgi:dipeptidyl aminopeptidase/acylaminoacyl peptidase